MSKRASQIAAEIHRAVQPIIDRGLQDPRLSGAMLTVTEVRVGADLRNATVMVSIMPESREDLAMHGLTAAAGHIRRQVGNLLEIRQTPELTFKLDRSVKKQAGVLEAIARATTEREAQEQARAAAQPPRNREQPADVTEDSGNERDTWPARAVPDGDRPPSASA